MGGGSASMGCWASDTCPTTTEMRQALHPSIQPLTFVSLVEEE